MPRRKAKGEGAAPGTPPGMVEDPEKLKQDAAALGEDAPKEEPEKRKYTKRKEAELPFPVEALTYAHVQVWKMIAERFSSRYELSPEGAAEMSKYAEVCLRQYFSPILAEHSALAFYGFTQVTAIMAMLAMRESVSEDKEVPALPPTAAETDRTRKPPKPFKEGFVDDDINPKARR